MESVSASPDTAVELIMRTGAKAEEASALAARAMECPDLEELRAALANVHDGLTEAAAALRAKEVSASVLALAREAGEAEGEERGYERGYERGLEDGRREGQAARRSRARLALVHREAG